MFCQQFIGFCFKINFSIKARTEVCLSTCGGFFQLRRFVSEKTFNLYKFDLNKVVKVVLFSITYLIFLYVYLRLLRARAQVEVENSCLKPSDKTRKRNSCVGDRKSPSPGQCSCGVPVFIHLLECYLTSCRELFSVTGFY